MNFPNSRLGIACDHTGLELKNLLLDYLASRGITEVADFGTFTAERCDYPDFAHKLGEALVKGLVGAGIAICGTGNGMAMTLNKYPSIRAGLAWNAEIAALVSGHNKANVLVLPARFITEDEALRCVAAWLDTPFQGEQHAVRLEKMVKNV